jgi:PAS domain S-box-containing protein
LYSELRPLFGYDPIALQVLEREGWYHHFAIDHGLLQDVRRRRLSESIFRPNYDQMETVVGYPKPAKLMVPDEARGPGGDRAPQTVIWVPIQFHGQVIGAVIYQLYARRRVSAVERALLKEVHAHMGVVVNSAYLNELTRNQAVSLGALNAIARALSATRDEDGVVGTLRNTLGPLLPIDELDLTILTHDTDVHPRRLSWIDGTVAHRGLRMGSPEFEPVRKVLGSGRPVLEESQTLSSEYPSVAWVPIKEGGDVSAVLSVRSRQADAYEQSTLLFLQQVADQVGLALRNAWSYASVERQAHHLELANAALQTERRRLETLHVLESGVAGAADERQITEALFQALRRSVDSSGLLLVYLDTRGRLAGFVVRPGSPIRALPPKPVEQTAYFKRLAAEPRTIVEDTPSDIRGGRASSGWSVDDPDRWPAQVVWVPLTHGDRVVGALSVQRYEDRPFVKEEVELVESAAPVVGIALRTVRLHRANELALRHSVRIQELAALAGHDLTSVVNSVAEQGRSMLDAEGSACWAFNEEGRVAAEATVGNSGASQVLKWAGPDLDAFEPLTGVRHRSAWSLVPLHYGPRLVGALGFLLSPTALDESINAPEDFVRTAAVAIENARLVAETWGRIRTLEAVAAFADLDIGQPEHARAEMGRLAERALADARGTLWLVDGTEMVSTAARRPADRLPLPRSRNAKALQSLANSARRRMAARAGLRLDQVLAAPVLVDGELAGMLTADAVDPSPAEIKRLLSVLASQIGLVLGRLRLVSALDRQAETMDAILRNSPVGVVLEDSSHRVIYVNPAIERIYGVGAHSIIGHPVERLLAESESSVVAQPEAQPDGPMEVRLGKKGDKVVQIRRVPIPNPAEHQGGLLTLHEDVTEERAALDAKDLMLRAVGHEVRSPAAAMRATIASLLQWDHLIEPGQRRGVLEDAYEQSDRLLNLVEAQLIIAKLEAGAFRPTPASVSLKETAAQVQRVLNSRYGDRVEAVRFQFSAEAPDAYCEPTHLEQALTNLIGNSLEHSWATRIVVTASAQDGWLKVSVQDNGRGLPPDRVATLFSRSPAGQHRNRGGLGLGLYLCRLIVERSFEGRVWLDQTGPKGSTFKFTVRAASTARTVTTMKGEQVKSNEPD